MQVAINATCHTITIEVPDSAIRNTARRMRPLDYFCNAVIHLSQCCNQLVVGKLIINPATFYANPTFSAFVVFGLSLLKRCDKHLGGR